MYEPLFTDLFDYILFDLLGTLMVGGDRLSDPIALTNTYRGLGGEGLDDERGKEFFERLTRGMQEVYEDPDRFDSFPSIGDYLTEAKMTGGLSEEDLKLIDRTVGLHELGTIPQENIDAVRRLATTSRVGIVSNIWSSGETFRSYLHEQGLDGLFEVVIFSSDSRSVKPSPELFRKALEAFGNPNPGSVLYIGDDYERDIVGARHAGLGTILVDPNRPDEPTCGDRVVVNLGELEKLR